MKKLLFTIVALFALQASAQKFALVDMEYILKHVPAYERANEQLNQVSKKWQAEVDALTSEAQTLYKKRESLMAPIQDEIYNAVKDISDQKGYSLILDRASDAGIIFASPKIDISNEVLTKLGYN